MPIKCYYKIILEFAVAVAVASLLSCCLATVASAPWLIVAFLLPVDPCPSTYLNSQFTGSQANTALHIDCCLIGLSYPLYCCGCPDMHQQPLSALLHNNRQLVIVINVVNCFPFKVPILLLLLSCCTATAVSNATTF